ncbi:MAG: hypothetical protein SGPRY_011765 [Prymnesium sp.]
MQSPRSRLCAGCALPLALLGIGAMGGASFLLSFHPSLLGPYLHLGANAYLALLGSAVGASCAALCLLLLAPLDQWLSRGSASPLSDRLGQRPLVANTSCCELTRPDSPPEPVEPSSRPASSEVLGVPALQLGWEEVSYAVGRTRLLEPSSGQVGGGIWGMIGPSGAGKSTLLGVLSGRKARGEVGGRVYLNGSLADPAARRQLLGYVTQDDILPGTSTPAEHLHFHAALRLSYLRPRRRRELVGAMLGALRLEHLADQRIGDAFVRGLSGGERRRVSVAIELLVLHGRGSGLLLMDEPLSGLDSVSSRLLMDAL